jgi:serine/threonine protein kinase
MVMQLLVVDGADQDRIFTLPEEVELTIGSSRRHTDICLHDLHVRRVHCTVQVQGDRVLVTDGEDSPGTYVNGQKVSTHELRPGDVLRVGNSHLRLQSIGGDDEEEAADEEAAPAAPAKLPDLPADRLAELSGHTLSHYELGPALGLGHSGVVFRARDLKGGQVVALKVLAPEFPKDTAEMQRFVGAMRRVLPLRHPHLVNLFNAGKTGPYCWFALEYVEGESLTQILERIGSGSRLNWKHAFRLAVHVGRALDFIHGQRLIHGNITPWNILTRLSDKLIKLNDLMLAKALEGSALQSVMVEGKLLAELPYLSPEQADPDSAYVDSLSDIYSLGAVVYARLTGVPPFQGANPEETLALIHGGALVKPRHHQPDIPEAFEAVVLKMLSRHQEDRYQTTEELLADLQRIAEEEEVTV